MGTMIIREEATKLGKGKEPHTNMISGGKKIRMGRWRRGGELSEGVPL